MTAHEVSGFDVAEGGNAVRTDGRKSSDALAPEVTTQNQSHGLALDQSHGDVSAPLSGRVPPRAFTELYLDEFGLAAQIEESREPDDGTRAKSIPITTHSPDPDETERSGGPDEGRRIHSTGGDAAAMYAAYVTLLDRWLGKLLQIAR